MKKIKLDAKRLQLKKTKIADLTDDGKSRIMGGDSGGDSGDECRTGPTTSMACTMSCGTGCASCGTTCYTCPPPPPPPPTGTCPTNIGCPSLTSLLLCV